MGLVWFSCVPPQEWHPKAQRHGVLVASLQDLTLHEFTIQLAIVHLISIWACKLNQATLATMANRGTGLPRPHLGKMLRSSTR